MGRKIISNAKFFMPNVGKREYESRFSLLANSLTPAVHTIYVAVGNIRAQQSVLRKHATEMPALADSSLSLISVAAVKLDRNPSK